LILPDDVFEYCNVLLTAPNATVIVPGERHWPLFIKLCLDAKASGNLVQDA
jgi:hypothetical protein